MGKHTYEDLGPREIMSCTRIYPRGVGFENGGPVITITITRDVNVYSTDKDYIFETGMVPSRPTGAHRMEHGTLEAVICLYNPTFGRYFLTPRDESLYA